MCGDNEVGRKIFEDKEVMLERKMVMMVKLQPHMYPLLPL
jgi:hypothetical protein